jgi:hypothetical protein
MWKTLTFISGTLALLTIVGTEIVRSRVHRLREESRGIGGTQDIAMVGTFITLVFLIVTAISCVMWLGNP